MANEPLPSGWAALTIAALTADLMSVAAPLVYTRAVAGVDALPSGPSCMDLALDLDLLLLDRGAVAGPLLDDNGSGFFTSADAELLGGLGLTDDPAPGCTCGEGEAADDPRAPPSPTTRFACDFDGPLEIAGACDNPGSRLGVIHFPGTSHDRSISSRSLALALFECFAPFLPFSRRRSNALASLSVLVSAKVSWMISSRSSSGARGYGHRDEPHGMAQAHGAQDRY